MKPLQHGVAYFFGNGLTMLASVLSLAVLTRFFDATGYGLLNLVVITITALATLAGCGLPQAAVRFFWSAEVQTDQSRFFSTQLFGSALLGLTGVLLVEGILWLAPVTLWIGEPTTRFLKLFAPWMLVMVLAEAAQNLFRTLQRPWWFNALSLWRKWGALALSVALLLLGSRQLEWYFSGQALAELAAVAAGVAGFWGIIRLRGISFSTSWFWMWVRYGLPHTAVILGNLLLMTGDRYVVRYVVGEAGVGLYAAAFNVASVVAALLSRPLNLTIFPLYTETWEREGAQATQSLLSRTLTVYVSVAILAGAVFLPLRRDLLAILAGPAFERSADLLPLLFIGLIVQSLFSIVVAGLYVSQQTRLVAGLTFISVAVNLGLNIVLVPRLGLIGAALSLLVGAVLQLLAVMAFAFRVLPVGLDVRRVIKAVLVGGMLYLVLAAMPSGARLDRLAVRLLVAGSMATAAYGWELRQRLGHRRMALAQAQPAGVS